MRLWFTLAPGVQEKQFDVIVGGKAVFRNIRRPTSAEGAIAVSHEQRTKANGYIGFKFQSRRDKATVSLIEVTRIR